MGEHQAPAKFRQADRAGRCRSRSTFVREPDVPRAEPRWDGPVIRTRYIAQGLPIASSATSTGTQLQRPRLGPKLDGPLMRVGLVIGLRAASFGRYWQAIDSAIDDASRWLRSGFIGRPGSCATAGAIGSRWRWWLLVGGGAPSVGALERRMTWR